VKKTQFVLFKTRQKKANETMSIKINGQEIKNVESTKFLGIHMDSNLTWKHHIGYIRDKISKTCGILCKARHYLSTATLRTLYYTLVYPYLYYGNTIKANTYPTRLEPVIKLQKKVVRIITFSDFRRHSKPLFRN